MLIFCRAALSPFFTTNYPVLGSIRYLRFVLCQFPLFLGEGESVALKIVMISHFLLTFSNISSISIFSRISCFSKNPGVFITPHFFFSTFAPKATISPTLNKKHEKTPLAQKNSKRDVKFSQFVSKNWTSENKANSANSLATAGHGIGIKTDTHSLPNKNDLNLSICTTSGDSDVRQLKAILEKNWIHD